MAIIDNASEKELERLIREAGKALLCYWPGGSPDTLHTDLDVKKKKDGSLVTKADFESNEILISGLNKLFPDDGIFSEERAGSDSLNGSERVWIIDPLDGTKTFVEGNDDFSILVSLCIRGRIEFGVMYFPARNMFAQAAKGRGAILDRVRLQVSNSVKFRDRSVYLRHLAPSQESWRYDKWMDSGMAFLSLCRGDFDGIVIHLIHHQEWDLAAQTVMIEESGGMVTDEHGHPVSFKRGPVDYNYLVASNGRVHDKLLKLIPTPRAQN